MVERKIEQVGITDLRKRQHLGHTFQSPRGNFERPFDVRRAFETTTSFSKITLSVFSEYDMGTYYIECLKSNRSLVEEKSNAQILNQNGPSVMLH